jgi:hypothetical protein
MKTQLGFVFVLLNKFYDSVTPRLKLFGGGQMRHRVGRLCAIRFGGGKKSIITATSELRRKARKIALKNVRARV